MSKEAKILTAILVVVVGAMIGLFVIANQGGAPAPTGDKTKITRDTSHKTGAGTVTMVEFGDYQCPACGAAYPNVKQLMKDYDGKITFYFRNFPLVNVHQNANASANAAEAARKSNPGRRIAGEAARMRLVHHEVFDGRLERPVSLFVKLHGMRDRARIADEIAGLAQLFDNLHARFRRGQSDETFVHGLRTRRIDRLPAGRAPTHGT